MGLLNHWNFQQLKFCFTLIVLSQDGKAPGFLWRGNPLSSKFQQQDKCYLRMSSAASGPTEINVGVSFLSLTVATWENVLVIIVSKSWHWKCIMWILSPPFAALLCLKTHPMKLRIDWPIIATAPPRLAWLSKKIQFTAVWTQATT